MMKSNSLWQDSWVRLQKNKGAMFSMYFIILVSVLALFAGVLSPYPFDEIFDGKEFLSPNSKFWFGTDSLGRDLFSRTLYGARMSMAVGIITALISMVIGTVYGSISGWFGGRIDSIMMRFVDTLIAIPSLVLLILVKVFFDSFQLFESLEARALTGMVVALSMVGWVTLARVVRGQVLQVKELTYVEAARALGFKPAHILRKYIIPNILGPIIVLLTFQIPSNILSESFLSFIGLGLQPPYSSWGVLANDGWKAMQTYPHLIFPPGVAIFLTLLAFNLFGDGLRDALDPKMKT